MKPFVANITSYLINVFIVLFFLFIYNNVFCSNYNLSTYDSLSVKSVKEIVPPSRNLKINEISASNLSCITDNSGDFDDWIELYNYGDDTINLNGLFISDTHENLSKFQIINDTLLAPQKYIILWADEESEEGILHLNFKLNANGEKIYISNDSLSILDSVSFGYQTTNISYGRLKDNFLLWNYFEEPSPGQENASVGLLEILDPPRANYQSGHYSSQIDVTLVHSDPEISIYYTLNGDEPTINSSEYTVQISVSATTILRYRAFKTGYVPSQTETKTFFFNENKNLDIISIAGNNSDITGSYGLFMTKKKDDEKAVHIEYFGNDRRLKFKLDGGIQLHNPKQNPQLSLRLYARSDYGCEKIGYQVFKNKDIHSFKRLILRNGGNDGTVLKTKSLTHFRDGFHQILFEQMGHGHETSAYKSVNVYINGNYYGIYNLRERIDKYFIESNYSYQGDMDLLERAFNYPGNRNAIEGNFELYDSIITFMIDNDLTFNTNYNYVNNFFDIRQYIDYWIHEVFIGNFDWLNNNIKIYRPRIPDSKFKWILWDTDHGSGLPYSDYGNPNWKTLSWSVSIGQSRTEGGSNNILQRNLIKNEGFRIQFINRYADLLNTLYQYNNIEHTIDSLTLLLEDDMKSHTSKWGCDYSYWTSAIKSIKNYYKSRPYYVRNDIIDCFSLNNLFNINLKTNNQEAGNIKINTIVPEFVDNRWSGQYFSNVPITVEAVPHNGYRFAGWSNIPFSDKTLKLTLFSDTTIEANFEPLDFDSSQIIINEIYLSSNEDSEYGDWIELLNKSGVDIPLYNWRLINSSDTITFGNVILKNDDYIVVTNKKNSLSTKSEPTTFYFNSFSLNGTSDFLQLLNKKNKTVDFVNFTTESPWPTLPSQYNFSLELADFTSDNSLPENWRSGIFLGGTPGKANAISSASIEVIKINELMASNSSTIQDNFGEYDDWIELYNKGDVSINLKGLFITDNINNPVKYQIPDYSEPIIIEPNEFLLLWADDNNRQGTLHLNFKLAKGGEELALFWNNGYELVKFEEIQFGEQYTNVSVGAVYDGINTGIGNWSYLQPTPGWSNHKTGLGKILADDKNNDDFILFPVPAQNHLSLKNRNGALHNNIQVEIYNLLGIKQKFSQVSVDNTSLTIDIHELEKGFYLVNILIPDRKIITKTFLK